MKIPANVLVKVDDRGRMKVFVDDKKMDGVISVIMDHKGGEIGTLTIIVSGASVRFEQVESTPVAVAA